MSKLWGAGIVTPWLYYMGVCSTFAAHFEDYAFGSANVIVAPPDTQAWVIWYSVPRESLAAFHAFLRDLLGKEYTLDCLEGRRLWIDPRLVAECIELRGQPVGDGGQFRALRAGGLTGLPLQHAGALGAGAKFLHLLPRDITQCSEPDRNAVRG